LPKNFFEHLKEQLTHSDVGFVQSEADPCLFISDDVILITYVDDILLYSPHPESISSKLEALRGRDLKLEEESDVAGFLGVLIIRRKDGTLEMTQTGLIDRIIDATGLKGANPKDTPGPHGALPKDEDGEPASEFFSYPSVVGMLQYLQGHTRPDITFQVNQCARYSHNTKRSHEKALKHVVQYLLRTRDKGLILKPSQSKDKDVSMDCYVDADFAGLWSYEDPHDTSCVKSRTGYVILVGGVPVLWASKLQTKIALSTMEAEYVALSTAMKELIPMRRLVTAVCHGVGLEPRKLTKLQVTVHEDNNGCLTLARLEPGRYTPRSKHYALEYHWFRTELKTNNIKIVGVDTKLQMADMFTKGLRVVKFQKNRKQLMHW